MQALDDAYAEDPSSTRMQRNCHLYQGEGVDDDDEVAMLEIDDEFVPALASGASPALHPDGGAPTVPQTPPHRVVLDGVFRPPQATA